MDTRSHYFAIAAALLIASPAAAQQQQQQPAEEPEKAPQLKVADDEDLVVKASVQLAERPATSETAVPKRPRAARVTTCRCGDPSAQ